MTRLALNLLPVEISTETLENLLNDASGRTLVLQATVRRFAERYKVPLEVLEARLARGEGSEHPDWEDSIEWRNALMQISAATTPLPPATDLLPA